MQTMQPVMKWGRNAWDRINMPVTEFRTRAENIRKEMKKEGIDLLLIYANQLGEYGDTCYVSNYVTMMPNGILVVLPLTGEPALLFEGFGRGLEQEKRKTWIEELRVGPDVARECLKYLEEKEIAKGTVGLVGLRELMPYHQWRHITEGLKQCRLVDAGKIIRERRMVKSDKEVDQIRRSARILSGAFKSLNDIVVTPGDERTLHAALERNAYLDGAEDCRVLLARPQDERWDLKQAEDRSLATGDIVIVYLAVEFERYWADGIRTFTVGSPQSTEANIKKVFDSLLKGIKPGMKASELHAEVVKVLPEKDAEILEAYGAGQGIGLSLGEAPVIDGGDDTSLVEGMCFSLRLIMSDKATGTNMLGHTLLISAGGAEILSR